MFPSRPTSSPRVNPLGLEGKGYMCPRDSPACPRNKPASSRGLGGVTVTRMAVLRGSWQLVGGDPGSRQRGILMRGPWRRPPTGRGHWVGEGLL